MISDQLITSPESKTLEFKRDLSSPDPMLKTLVAFANTAGGHLIVGIDDERQVIGVEQPLDEEERICSMIADSIAPRLAPNVELMTIEGRTVLLVEVFLSGLRPHYLKAKGPENGVYVRLGSTNRQADRELVAELRRTAEGIAFDELPMPELTIDDLDLEAAKNLFGRDRKPGEEELITLKLLTSEQGRIVPTKGAVLLFGKKRTRYFPDAWIQCGRFTGRDKAVIFDHIELYDHLPQAVESIMLFLKKHAMRGADLSGIRRKDVWSIPLGILREVVINALVHADYSQRGAPTRIAFFDDRIEVENPGILLPGMTIDDMKQGISKIRNPVLARIFRELGLIEQWGSGVRRIIKEAEELGLPELEILEIGMRLRFIVPLAESIPIMRSQHGAQSGAQSEAQSGAQSMDVLTALVDAQLSAAELTEALGLHSKTGAFKRTIKELLEQDLIEYTIPDKPNSRMQKYRLTQKGTHFLTTKNTKKHEMKEKTNNPVPNFFLASAEDFKKIPGSPIAYWVSEKVWAIFGKSKMLGDNASPKIGMRTGDNERFMRNWHEVNLSKTSIPSNQDTHNKKKWVPYNKGGTFRKWYGNFVHIVNWENDGFEIKENTLINYPQLSWDNLGWKISNENFYFHEGVTWTDLSSASFGVRYLPEGFIFDAAGPCLFGERPLFYLSFLVTKQCFEFLKMLNPTFHFKNYNISALPIIDDGIELAIVEDCASMAIELSKSDWDSYETSWDFTNLQLLNPSYHKLTLPTTYSNLRTHWRDTTLEMQNLEQENNRIFIKAYGLEDELTPDLPLSEITLTCNPHYRYNGNKTENELEDLLLADTIKEFISYAVGCMFGRYSLDKPGLILASQGETIEDYINQVPNPTFVPDHDNVIPILDGDWFIDDIADRLRRFLRVTFGEEHYEENLKFIENAIGKDIRRYFLKDFYNHHVKMYKKRPIYWMFSSPNGSFNALIYMHRYRPDTVSIVLNNYLREFRSKIAAKKENLEQISSSPSSSQSDKAKALKEIEKLKKVITELEDYERDVLYPLATQQIEIDLDDGVKVNYNKFGKALRKLAGLTGK